MGPPGRGGVSLPAWDGVGLPGWDGVDLPGRGEVCPPDWDGVGLLDWGWVGLPGKDRMGLLGGAGWVGLAGVRWACLTGMGWACLARVRLSQPPSCSWTKACELPAFSQTRLLVSPHGERIIKPQSQSGVWKSWGPTSQAVLAPWPACES